MIRPTYFAVACALLFLITPSEARTELASLEFADIQAALDACPDNHDAHGLVSGGCVIELPCGQNRIQQTPNAEELRIASKQNVRIRGCGMNGTRLTWSVDSGYSAPLLRINSSRWITIEDVMLEAIDGPGSSSNEVKVVEVRASQDVTFERVHFHAASTHGPASYPTAIRLGDDVSIASDGSATVRTIGIRDSRIHSTGIGLLLAACDDCWVSGTWFGAIPAPTNQQHKLLQKRLGTGVRIINNTFDFNGESGPLVGVELKRNRAIPPTPGATSQVIGNSFIGLRENHIGVLFYGYNHAMFAQNMLRCATPGSCSNGVRFRMHEFESQENLIVDNVFSDFSSKGPNCPIGLQRKIERNNVVARNIFHLSRGSDPVGVCLGVEINKVSADNYVFMDP